MNNQDLEIAKTKLIKENLSLVIVKNKKVMFKTKKQGINGFLDAIALLNMDLNKSSVADKIIGVAAAMLCVYSGISAVFAQTISESGIKILKEKSIIFSYKKKVSNILDRKKTEVCPFEKIAIKSKTSEEAYDKLIKFSDTIIGKINSSKC